MYTNHRWSIVYGEPVAIGEYTVSAELPRGTMMELSDTDGEYIDACVGGETVPLGFLARNTDDEGVTLEDMVLGRGDTKVEVGEKVTVYQLPAGSVIEVECENSKAYNTAQPDDTADGYLLVTSSTGAITASLNKDTKLACQNGRWRVAQTGDFVCGQVQNSGLTPKITATNIRVRILIINGYVAS